MESNMELNPIIDADLIADSVMPRIISHFERKSRPCKLTVSVEHPVRSVEVRKTVLDDVTRRVVTTIEYQEHDNAELINKYSVSDFSLENLMSIGAKLDPLYMSPSAFAIQDKLQSLC